MLTPRQWRQLWYVPVLATAMALMMARIMAAARLLDVHAFAAYNTGLLISSTFCMLGCLGVQALLQRDMPILLARRRERAALVLMMQALLVACICAAALVVPIVLGSGAVHIPPGLAAISALHGLSQQAFLVATVESRSRGDALRYGRQNLWRSAGVAAGGMAVAAATGSPQGILATEAALTLLLVGGILRGMQRQDGWRAANLAALAWRSWRRIAWPTAGVMLAISFVTFALMNVDRWVAASLLTQAGFAHFAFAAIVLTVAQAIQSMVNASVYPMIARRFALQGTAAAFRLARMMSLASLVAGVLLSWPAYALAQAVIARWFPSYEASIVLLGPMLAAGILRVSDYWSSFLMICNLERHLLRVQAVVCGTAGVLWLVVESARGPFAPGPIDIAWLTFVLAFASHTASAASAFALRNRGSLPTQRQSLHAQSQ